MCDIEHTQQGHRRDCGLVVPAMQPSSGGFLMKKDWPSLELLLKASETIQEQMKTILWLVNRNKSLEKRLMNAMSMIEEAESDGESE